MGSAAKSIPARSTVTKRTGNAEYVLQNTIKVYQAPDGVPNEIKADGCFFLIGARGNINAISGDTELMWKTTGEELLEYLREIYDVEDYR